MSASAGKERSASPMHMELTALEENRMGGNKGGAGAYGNLPEDEEVEDMGGHVFRKYESTVNSPESLRNGEPHPEVKRQESIMRHVYVRMKDNDLHTVADNLAPRYMDISSGSGSRRRVLRLDTLQETMDTMKPLPRRKSLGLFDLEFSLCMTMSLAFSLLMGLGLLIMIVISSEFTSSILRAYDAAFDNSLAQLVQGTASIVNTNAESFGLTIVREFATSVDQGLIVLPVHALADAWFYYLSQPDKTESFTADLLQNGLLCFVYYQMQYFFYPIPNFYFALTTNDMYGYKFPRILIEGEYGIDSRYFLFAEADDSDVSPYEARLYSCPITGETGESELANCSSSQEGIPYNTTQRPFFVIQSQRAYEKPRSSSVYLISDLYPYASHAEGYTVTWPINTCNNYTCFEGVIGADVTTASASQLCNLSLYNALSQLTGETDLGNITAPATFYVLVRKNVDGVEPTEGNQSGWLVGAAVNNATFDGPLPRDGRFQAADDPRAPLIAQSSTFLQRAVGAFASEGFNTPQFYSFNNETMEECSCVEFHDKKTLSRDLFECFTVSTHPAGTYRGSQGMYLASNVSWLAVAVLPCSLFLQNLNTTISTVQATIAQQEAASKDAERQQLITAIVIACILMLGVIVVAVLLASWISRSLVRVQRAMQALRRFEFNKNAVKRYSRIKEVAEIQETFLALRRALYAFAKFVPSTVVKNIVEGGEYSSKLHVQNKQVTILFSDIASFTSIAEKLEINDLLYLLTSYLTVMTRIVENYEGVVAEILGDGLLVYWNTPDDVKDHAAKGLATALACQQTIKTSFNSTFQELYTRYGLDPIKVRIGVHTGVVLTGNMGSDKKMKFGCMGDPVNLASRLEGLCKLYGVEILCSEETMKNLPTRDTFYVRELDLVRVQGKSKATRIYEVISQDSAVHNICETGTSSKQGLSQPKPTKSETQGPSEGSSPNLATASLQGGTRSLWNRAFRKAGQKASGGKMKSSSTRTEMVFQVQDATVDNTFRLNVAKYVEALHAFQAGDFAEAKKVLIEVQEPDRACKYLLERIERELQGSGTPEERTSPWSGVNILYGKEF